MKHVNGRVKLEDGSTWCDPSSHKARDIKYRMIHEQETITKEDMHYAVAVMNCYSELICNPAFTLKTVQKKVSMIRKIIFK